MIRESQRRNIIHRDMFGVVKEKWGKDKIENLELHEWESGRIQFLLNSVCSMISSTHIDKRILILMCIGVAKISHCDVLVARWTIRIPMIIRI